MQNVLETHEKYPFYGITYRAFRKLTFSHDLFAGTGDRLLCLCMENRRGRKAYKDFLFTYCWEMDRVRQFMEDKKEIPLIANNAGKWFKNRYGRSPENEDELWTTIAHYVQPEPEEAIDSELERKDRLQIIFAILRARYKFRGNIGVYHLRQLNIKRALRLILKEIACLDSLPMDRDGTLLEKFEEMSPALTRAERILYRMIRNRVPRDSLRFYQRGISRRYCLARLMDEYPWQYQQLISDIEFYDL